MATIVITCPSCRTKFRLDSDRLNKAGSKVRCSKCHNVFMVEQPDEDDLIHIEISEEENDFISAPNSYEDRRASASSSQIERGKGGESGNKFLVAGILAVSLILVIALIFELGSRFQIFKGKNPPVSVVDKPHVTVSENVKAYYLENTNAGEVLVIEGTVVNQSSKPVSFVMIQGKLFNRKNTAVLTQSCYAGNPLTRREIIHLKLSEIQDRMMNREGQNLKDVRIPPSGSATFVLVFHNLPEINTLTNYSVNVLSSQLD